MTTNGDETSDVSELALSEARKQAPAWNDEELKAVATHLDNMVRTARNVDWFTRDHIWDLVLSLVELYDARATSATLRAALPTCAHCRKHHAVCFGTYEGSGWSFACDECCGHGCEDGECFDLSATWEKMGEMLNSALRERDESEATSATLRAELASKARQIHRLQTGQDIEGDHVPEYVSNEEHMQALAELADLRAEVEALRVESDDRRERLHDTAHILIEKIGAPSGPENADSVARRAASRITELEAQVAARDRTIGTMSERVAYLEAWREYVLPHLSARRRVQAHTAALSESGEKEVIGGN